MSSPLLSILIPTVFGREEYFDKLMKKLWSLNYPEVQVYTIKDNKEITIGEKREQLYQSAEGLYSWQIDDDDDIADDAIERILGVIKTANNVDCITFQESVNIDGRMYSSNFRLDYADWRGDGSKLLEDGFHYQRTPFFKCVIKTEIAKSVPIPHIRFGEDHQWAQALKPHLKTEVHIPRNVYFYQHISSNPTERYGLDK